MLGKRLARAFGAWTMATVALQALKDGSEARPSPRAARHVRLHLVLMAARPLLETATVYPAALAVLPAVASLVPYVLLSLA